MKTWPSDKISNLSTRIIFLYCIIFSNLIFFLRFGAIWKSFSKQDQTNHDDECYGDEDESHDEDSHKRKRT